MQNFLTVLKGIRPKTLSASLGPLILSFSLVESASFNHLYALYTLFSCLSLQIASNLVNDYFDNKNGIDSGERIGPARIANSSQLKLSFVIFFILGFLFGIPLMIKGGMPIIILGLLSITTAYLYTAGPYPLSYYYLGELLAFIFFGPIAVGGCYYIQTGSINTFILIISAGPGLIAALLMSVNNLRDIESDKKTRKKTIAILLGEKRARWFSLSLLVAALVLPILLDNQYSLTALSVLPFTKQFKKIINDKIDSSFNEVLASTGQFLLIYSCLFAASINLWK